MSSDPHQIEKWRHDVMVASRWSRRRDIPLAILAWAAVAAIIFWAMGHIISSLLLLLIASILAYALTPAVKLLQRIMPRPIAIGIVYLIVLSGLGGLVYLVITTSIDQVSSLARFLQHLLGPEGSKQLAPLVGTLKRFGISQSQLDGFGQQVLTQAENVATSAVPILTGFFSFLLDTILVAVISIYLLVDGGHITSWLRRNMPLSQQARTNFLLDTLQRIVGGYIRGQFLLAALIGVLVGVGMAIFQVPYAVLLGVLAFVLEFIPVLGTLVSGAICVLIALTVGWITALLVLAYFVIVHIVEGDIVGPRIVGQAIGLHPIVSLVALVAGGELFGIWGALFASPLAGVIQALIVALWTEWRETHPSQFRHNNLVENVIGNTVDTLTKSGPEDVNSSEAADIDPEPEHPHLLFTSPTGELVNDASAPPVEEPEEEPEDRKPTRIGPYRSTPDRPEA
ncbi:MAG TPA: AI-2E family transporter [Ktedonobacteraceae bacterium]|nr:AI-2E family transporter [Ktedonobacteraceae bacterium]